MLTKLVPVRVIVVAGSFTIAEFGLMLVSVGTGLLAMTSRDTMLDVPPDGVGFVAVIWTVCTVVRSAAGIVTINVVVVNDEGTRPVSVPKVTVVLLLKPVPVSMIGVFELFTAI